MTTAAVVTTDAAAIATIGDYLGLSPEQRYNEVSQHFPPWLLLEPIEFPAHHATYGWACRVEGCEATMTATRAQLLCDQHGKAFRRVEKSTSLEEFIRGAKPSSARSFGWAL